MFAHNRFSTAAWLILVLCIMPVQAAENTLTPDVVYAQAVQVEKEIDLLKRHYKITAVNPVDPIETELLPRHIWQKSYAVLIKINIFRRKSGLNGFAPVAQEPELAIDLRGNWGQIQRILTEIRIAKNYLGVNAEVSPAKPVQGKREIDVFNKLNQISYNIDTLNGEPIGPSYVYAEVLRINEDINAVMRKTGTVDNAVPPPRNVEATPKNALDAAFSLMKEIQRLQRQLELANTDFGAFQSMNNGNVMSADVFNMVTLCLGELQMVKAKLGMKHKITPAAEFNEGKTPVDVAQLLGYLTNKLGLIKVK